MPRRILGVRTVPTFFPPFDQGQPIKQGIDQADRGLIKQIDEGS